MKKVLLLLLVLLIAALAYTQEAGTESAVPFVSKLKAKVDESHILITWHNPKNLKGSILLYRHIEEIDAQSLDAADLIARLTAAQESYQDTPQDYRAYFYAVLIEDASGTVQKLFIPFRNKTSDGVRVAVLPVEEKESAEITALRASVVGDAVQIVFQSSNPGRGLLLFRSTAAMTTIEDLIEAYAPLQLEAGTTRFIDYPIPGVQTYYAVVDTEQFKLGKQKLVPGENATDRAVVVPMEVQRIGLTPPPEEQSSAAVPETQGQPSTMSSSGEPATEIRQERTASTSAPEAERIRTTTPLPYLQLAHRITGPQRQEQLDDQTKEAIARLLSAAPPAAASQTTLTILPEEKSGVEPSESVGLQKIVTELLQTGDYQGAEARLQGFLNLRRSAYTEARVRFYLGQAYYFQGLYEEALLEFVLSQDQLYAPVQPWLESCFRQLWNTR
jgi:hypothetical protein